MKRVRLRIDAAALRLWLPLWQRGVRLSLRSGASVHEFLCRELGLDPAYVEGRIQTVLLDGKPVDDLQAARLHPGAVLALSGPMPGLAGATLRRAGFFGSLRYQISHAPEADREAQGRGFVTLKLFNVLIRELGPRLFERGVVISGRELMSVLGQGKEASAECREIRIEGREVATRDLLETVGDEEDMQLKIEVVD